MRFAEPYLLLLLLIVPIAGIAAIYLMARREKALKRLTLNPPKTNLGGFQTICVTLGLTLVLLAASRPQWGQRDEADKIVRLSRNAIIVMDVSRSMLAEDVGSRLAQAKTGAAELIKGLLSTNSADRLGGNCALVTFAASGEILSPLTDDRAFLERTLANLSELSAKGGNTSISNGLSRALELIPSKPDGTRRTVRDTAIVLISDGGDLEGGALEAADAAKAEGVPILAVGVGRSDEESTIPLENGRLLLDRAGRPVKVKLESDALVKIAERSGGHYVDLRAAQADPTRPGVTLYGIYDDFIHRVALEEQAEEDKRAGQTLKDRFPLFLAPGLALLIAAASLSKGRFRKTRKI